MKSGRGVGFLTRHLGVCAYEVGKLRTLISSRRILEEKCEGYMDIRGGDWDTFIESFVKHYAVGVVIPNTVEGSVILDDRFMNFLGDFTGMMRKGNYSGVSERIKVYEGNRR